MREAATRGGGRRRLSASCGCATRGIRWRRHSTLLNGYRRSSERRGGGERQTALPLRSLFRCTALLIVAVASARQGRCALLTRRLPTAGAVRMLERAPAGQLYQPTDLRVCLRKPLGRRLTARSTLRSGSSAKLRGCCRRRHRRRPRRARATRVAQLSATSSA